MASNITTHAGLAEHGLQSPPLDPVIVRAQLERLLSSPHLRHSKRCQSLLTYVVEAYLDGSLDKVKERTIGFEVFHRDPDYDTNEDSVVRTTALDIRKRLAQYYAEAGHETDLRISLPAGSYVPEFRFPAPQPAPVELDPVVPVAAEARPLSTPRWAWAAAAVIVLAGAILTYMHFRPSELDLFWRPLLNDGADAIICIEQPQRIYRFDGTRFDELNQMMVGNPGTPPASEDARQKTSVQLSELRSAGDRYFSNGDVLAAIRVASLLARKGKGFEVLSDRSTAYHDLRGKPSVLLGQFNHRWLTDLTGGLRYRLQKNTARKLYEVFDSQDNKIIASTTSEENRPEEYVIVSRLFDHSTEKMVIAVAAMTFRGTAAGGDFLTNESYLRDAFAGAPKGWSGKNLQVVLQTTMVSGIAGPPKVVARHYF